MKIALYLLTRTLLIILGIVLLVLAAGFFFNHSSALSLWPWPDDHSAYIFVASILAATGAPVLWMGLSGELAAMRGGAFGLTVTYSGIAVMLLLFGGTLTEIISAKSFLTLAIFSVLFNMFLSLIAVNISLKDRRYVPWLIRASFLMFFLVLMAVGIALVMRYQWMFPWPLKPQTSVVFGWVSLGAAVYLFYGFLKPERGNVCGQLIALLAFDFVLLAPLLQHFATVQSEYQLSLYLYTGVLIYSALLSLYFLLFHSSTRLWSESDDMLYMDDSF